MGIAVKTSMARKTLRPPNRSAAIPVSSRQIEPLRMATAISQDSWTSVKPNSVRIGMPKTPNISHTANIRVKAMVLIVRTRRRPLRSSRVGLLMGSTIEPEDAGPLTTSSPVDRVSDAAPSPMRQCSHGKSRENADEASFG